jgi:DnaJ-class molecular chaperone
MSMRQPDTSIGGFRQCVACDGLGFRRRGAFGVRTFERCPACGGTGTIPEGMQRGDPKAAESNSPSARGQTLHPWQRLRP